MAAATPAATPAAPATPARASVQRIQDSIVAIQRLTNSRKLDALRARRSGVPLSLVATGVLHHVTEDGPVRPAVLAQRTRMVPAALSRQLGVLEREGCIERTAEPSDGRGSLVRSTPRGRAVSRRVERANIQLFTEQLGDWSTQELESTALLLERLVTDLRTPVDDPGRQAKTAGPPPGTARPSTATVPGTTTRTSGRRHACSQT